MLCSQDYIKCVFNIFVYSYSFYCLFKGNNVFQYFWDFFICVLKKDLDMCYLFVFERVFLVWEDRDKEGYFIRVVRDVEYIRVVLQMQVKVREVFWKW